MIRFIIYLFVIFLLFKKLFNVIINYKEYYSINRLKLDLVKVTQKKSKDKGLMFRKEPLKDNEGMLFVYKKPQKIKMWMKNTYIPLDLLFLDNKYNVIEMKKNLKPHDTKTNYSSSKLCKYAIEINAGSIKKNNIKIGTQIIPNYINKLN